MTDSTVEVKKEKLSGWKSLGVFILLDVALVLTFGVIGPKANADFWERLSNTAIRYALAGWGISYLVGRTLKRTLILAGVMYVIGLSFILTENAGHADHAHTVSQRR